MLPFFVRTSVVSYDKAFVKFYLVIVCCLFLLLPEPREGLFHDYGKFLANFTCSFGFCCLNSAG